MSPYLILFFQAKSSDKILRVFNFSSTTSNTSCLERKKTIKFLEINQHSTNGKHVLGILLHNFYLMMVQHGTFLNVGIVMQNFLRDSEHICAQLFGRGEHLCFPWYLLLINTPQNFQVQIEVPPLHVFRRDMWVLRI